MRPPEKMTKMFKENPAVGDLVYGGAVIHLLNDVNVPLSATEIRAAIAKGRPITKFVGGAVAEYIKKTKLYRAEADAGSPPLPRPKVEQSAKPKLQLVHGKSRSSR